MAKAGRPTKYRADFHPNDFIRLSKLGKNLTQIALEWDIDRDTIYDWGKKYPLFSGAIKKGRAFAEAWYVNIGQQAMMREGHGVNVNLGFYVWLTKNLFKWSDKVAVEPGGDEDRPLKDLSDEELDDL